MKVSNINIDGGTPFDWGRTSENYAKYRDIYPREFYDRIAARGLFGPKKTNLDLGTGTGVLPRNLVSLGGTWIGVDQSEEQINAARKLSEGLNISYRASSAETLSFPPETFDTVTACQCFWYFDHTILMPILSRILKKEGRILVLYMAWLPEEDQIAGASEALALKYNPKWSGAGERIHPIEIDPIYQTNFEPVFREEFLLNVPFTRETWHGRMKTCRGIGASLSDDEIARWEKEHLDLLQKIAPREFKIKHYGAITELKKR